MDVAAARTDEPVTRPDDPAAHRRLAVGPDPDDPAGRARRRRGRRRGAVRDHAHPAVRRVRAGRAPHRRAGGRPPAGRELHDAGLPEPRPRPRPRPARVHRRLPQPVPRRHQGPRRRWSPRTRPSPQGEVLDAGIVSDDADSARVLVVADSTVTNSARPQAAEAALPDAARPRPRGQPVAGLRPAVRGLRRRHGTPDDPSPGSATGTGWAAAPVTEQPASRRSRPAPSTAPRPPRCRPCRRAARLPPTDPLRPPERPAGTPAGRPQPPGRPARPGGRPGRAVARAHGRPAGPAGPRRGPGRAGPDVGPGGRRGARRRPAVLRPPPPGPGLRPGPQDPDRQLRRRLRPARPRRSSGPPPRRSRPWSPPTSRRPRWSGPRRTGSWSCCSSNQTTTSTRLEGPKVDLNRVRLTLDRVDGSGW